MLADVDELKSGGFEVHIGKVSAYSTLGWFDDPVLSSFINRPDHLLAGLLFHELTHQQVYIDDDTTFNESLASAVQMIGTELWLQARGQQQTLEKHSRWLQYRAQVIELIESTRHQLAGLYETESSDADKRKDKAGIFIEARRAHQDIASKHGVTGGFTNWFAGELNNAKIGSIAAYNSQMPAFINMIRAHRLNFGAFYEYVEDIGEFDKAERDSCLEAWNRQDAGNSNCPEFQTAEATAS